MKVIFYINLKIQKTMKKMLFAVMAMLALVSCGGSTVDVNTMYHEELVTIYNDATSKLKNAQDYWAAPDMSDIEERVEQIKGYYDFRVTKALLTSPKASEEEKKLVAELEAKVKAAEEEYYAARNEFDARMDAKRKERSKDFPSIF